MSHLRQSRNPDRDVEQAVAIRLRPILMTTLAMIVAMVPLPLATGPGAVSRFHIGLMIATGLSIGTLLVVPTVYVAIARARIRPDHETEPARPAPPATEQA